jgi:hypothetical protein
MMKCKMKQVTLAVGAVLGTLSLLPSAQAVNLATDGLGQALIFPYYTTRSGWNTLFNITNTSNQVVVIKVRFHEGYNSRDVFDFNVVMSPFDVWNGTLSNGTGNVPSFSTSDRTCTVPAIPAGGQLFQGSGANGTLAYTGAAADGGPTTTDRMREGYVSVVMMGTSPVTGLAANAVHNAAGVPANCAALRSAFALSGTTIAGLRAAFPNYAVNPLKGAFSLVNAENGWNAGGEAVTLANFSTVPLITAQLPPDRVANVFTDSFHEPDLNSGNTPGQVLLANGTPVSELATPGVAAVSFVLNRASVVNQWANLDAAPPANPWDVRSDWVVTFPTKRFHVDTASHQFAGQATGRPGLPGATPALFPPFSRVFSAGQSCDDVNYTIYNREEQLIIRLDEPVFSPAPSTPGNQLCEEVNVLTFGAGDTVTNVLKSPMGNGTLSGNVPELPGPNGWMQLNFRNAAGTLPVVGFAVINRTEPTGILNESFIVDNAYIRAAAAPAP